MLTGYIEIGNDVWIGHGAIILPNITIGNSAVIGAGSVVTHNVAPYIIVGGNPARFIKRVSKPKKADAYLSETALPKTTNLK